MSLKDIFSGGMPEQLPPQPTNNESVIGDTIFGGVLPGGQRYSHLPQSTPPTPESIALPSYPPPPVYGPQPPYAPQPPYGTQVPYGPQGQYVAPPPMTAEQAAQVQQQLLVPTENGTAIELLPQPEAPNSALKVIGQLSSYAATPVTAGIDTLSILLGAAKEPQKLFSRQIVELDQNLKTADQAQGRLEEPTTSDFISMLAEQINTTVGPARNKTSTDEEIAVRLPTQAERDLAVQHAPILINSADLQQSRQAITEDVRQKNFEMVRRRIKQEFSDEELRRSAQELTRLIESKENRLELMHIPPLNLIAAAVLADPTLLPKALSAALFANELKRRGITIVLQQNKISNKAEIRILAGGPGKGVEVLPANAQPEWNQPMPQEVASDTPKWGPFWFRLWQPNLKKFFTGKWKQIYPQNPTMVEAGTLTLVNPTDTSDRAKIPLLVTKDSRERTASGGAKAIQQAAGIAGSAEALINKSQELTRAKTAQRQLPVELSSTQLPPQNAEESLRRAYEEARRLLMSQGIRPEVVLRLAQEYADAIKASGVNSVNSPLEVPGFLDNRQAYNKLMDIIRILNTPNLDSRVKSALTKDRDNLLNQLRQQTR